MGRLPVDLWDRTPTSAGPRIDFASINSTSVKLVVPDVNVRPAYPVADVLALNREGTSDPNRQAHAPPVRA